MKDIIYLLFDANRGIHMYSEFVKQCRPETTYWHYDVGLIGPVSDHVVDGEGNSAWIYYWEDIYEQAYWQEPGTDIRYRLHEDDAGLWMIHEDWFVNDKNQLENHKTGEIHQP